VTFGPIKRVRRESSIEAAAVAYAKKRGWWQMKVMRASVRGIPDRWFIRDGALLVIEFKSERGRLSDHQSRRIEELRQQNVDVHVVDNIEQAKELLE
jgi:hypothetical protein